MPTRATPTLSAGIPIAPLQSPCQSFFIPHSPTISYIPSQYLSSSYNPFITSYHSLHILQHWYPFCFPAILIPPNPFYFARPSHRLTTYRPHVRSAPHDYLCRLGFRARQGIPFAAIGPGFPRADHDGRENPIWILGILVGAGRPLEAAYRLDENPNG